ncbi:MAG: branched-chain amino acid ABC transporter substrate-binding protein [Elusimicrobia bacterium]|nr:branched-chain amino acid ABC transporter substrate-binding protein [Elusimicrobiota bacterium]
MRVNLVGAFLLASCLGFFGCRARPRSATLAVAVPLSGDLAADGSGILRAVTMAVDEARDAGTLPLTIEVAAFDDKADPRAAAEIAERISRTPAVVAVIGHLTSGCSIEGSKVYARAGIPMLTPSATAPELTLQQTRVGWAGPRVVFRLLPSDAVQGSYAADFAYGKLALRRMAILQDQTAYGMGIAEEFRKRFLARGGAVAGVEAVSRGQRDFSGVLDDLRRWNIDGVLFGGVYTDFAPLLKQARAAGLGVPVFSGDGSKADDLFSLAGPACDGAYVTVSGVPVEHLPSAQDFVSRFKARYPRADEALRTFDDYAYEAARIVLESLRKSGPDRARLLEAIRSNSHETMLGDITFDSKGDTLKSLVTMTRADYKAKAFEPVIYDR